MDAETMRQVIVHIGKPAPRPSAWASVVHSVPARTWGLLVLLALSVTLWAQEARGAQGAASTVGTEGPGSARGAGPAGEPVQKGQGGVPARAHYPLRDSENFQPGASPPLSNFFHNFPDRGRPAPEAPLPPPFDSLVALVLFCLVIIWLHLRSQAVDEPGPSRGRRRR